MSHEECLLAVCVYVLESCFCCRYLHLRTQNLLSASLMKYSERVAFPSFVDGYQQRPPCSVTPPLRAKFDCMSASMIRCTNTAVLAGKKILKVKKYPLNSVMISLSVAGNQKICFSCIYIHTAVQMLVIFYQVSSYFTEVIVGYIGKSYGGAKVNPKTSLSAGMYRSFAMPLDPLSVEAINVHRIPGRSISRSLRSAVNFGDAKRGRKTKSCPLQDHPPSPSAPRVIFTLNQ